MHGSTIHHAVRPSVRKDRGLFSFALAAEKAGVLPQASSVAAFLRANGTSA
jgi:hypothetical protein